MIIHKNSNLDWNLKMAAAAIVCLLVLTNTTTEAAQLDKTKLYNPKKHSYPLPFPTQSSNCSSIYQWFGLPHNGFTALAGTAGSSAKQDAKNPMACSAQNWPTMNQAKSEALRRCNALARYLHVAGKCKIIVTK